MKIKAIAPWFGGKRNLAPKIVELLGPHRVYWEPFCGSMAVLMAKPPCIMETVNDLHADLINLAKVIQDRALGPQLYRRLRRTLMHEAIFTEAANRVKLGFFTSQKYLGEEISPDLDRAYDYFLCSWCGRNGVGGTQSYNQGFCVRYTNNGGDAGKRTHSAISSIPAWRRRLSKVAILNRDGFEILERIDDQSGTAIYVDPPYIEKGAKYIHDFEKADHKRLAELLKRFVRARVVVSYYNHPKLAELYPNWQRVEITITKSLQNQGRRDKADKGKQVVEVLLINQEANKLF